MAANVETMAYVGQTPWHGLGTEVPEGISPMEMMDEAGLNWGVNKLPLFYEVNGKSYMHPTHFGLIRTNDNSSLGICGKDYEPTQNIDVFRFFQETFNLKMQTAGSLDHGRHVWAMAKIDRSFDLPGGDAVNNHILVHSPHIWGKSLKLMHTSVRVVCMNTLTQAINGSTDSFRMLHTKVFDQSVQTAAAQHLGLSIKAAERFEESAKLLASKKCSIDMAKDYLLRVFTQSSSEYRKKIVSGNEPMPRKVDQVFQGLFISPGAAMKSAEGTFWGAFNAVSYYTDHVATRTQDARLQSAWFGPNATIKAQALDLAIELALKA